LFLRFLCTFLSSEETHKTIGPTIMLSTHIEYAGFECFNHFNFVKCICSLPHYAHLVCKWD
jgi:hypothetical protein